MFGLPLLATTTTTATTKTIEINYRCWPRSLRGDDKSNGSRALARDNKPPPECQYHQSTCQLVLIVRLFLPPPPCSVGPRGRPSSARWPSSGPLFLGPLNYILRVSQLCLSGFVCVCEPSAPHRRFSTPKHNASDLTRQTKAVSLLQSCKSASRHIIRLDWSLWAVGGRCWRSLCAEFRQRAGALLAESGRPPTGPFQVEYIESSACRRRSAIEPCVCVANATTVAIKRRLSVCSSLGCWGRALIAFGRVWLVAGGGATHKPSRGVHHQPAKAERPLNLAPAMYRTVRLHTHDLIARKARVGRRRREGCAGIPRSVCSGGRGRPAESPTRAVIGNRPHAISLT
jgi:hypothetical protein